MIHVHAFMANEAALDKLAETNPKKARRIRIVSFGFFAFFAAIVIGLLSGVIPKP